MEDTIKKIRDILNTGWPTRRNWLWLLGHLQKKVEKDKRSREKHKAYFQDNKEKIYDYHKKYRLDHPDYENRRRERGRKTD